MENTELGCCMRFKELRKALNIKQADFAKELAISQGHASDIENGRKSVSDRIIEILSLKYSVNDDWLRNGKGEMFREPSDEVGYYVADLLDYDGEGNAFYDAIIAMMKKYCQLDEKSKAIVKGFFEEIAKEMKKEDD